MKRSFALFALLSLVSVSLVHCRKNKGGEDASIEPASSDTATPEPPPSSAPTAPLASNADDIARFGEETKLADVQGTVVTATANARESPPNGPLVSILPKGTVVTQIAQRDAYVLATFNNPKNASELLMGWIFAPAVGGAAPSPIALNKSDASVVVRKDAGVAPLPVPTSCPAGLTLVMVDLPTCAKICAEDKECPTGQACKGSANKIVNGKAGDGVTTCVVYHHTSHDAGTPTPTPIKDAAAPTPTPTPDAAVAPAATGPEVPAVGGKCPATYVLVAKDGKCHRDCTAGAGVCGAARCTKKCGTTQSVCLVNAATCP